MSNHITIELRAEDRARLDKLTDALEKLATLAEPVKVKVEPGAFVDITPAETAQEAPQAHPRESVNPSPENAADEPTEDEAAPVSVTPTVTLEQIRQKVVQLCTVSEAAKAQVKAIINDYGVSVTALGDHPDKWDEVWRRLTALEG